MQSFYKTHGLILVALVMISFDIRLMLMNGGLHHGDSVAMAVNAEQFARDWVFRGRAGEYAVSFVNDYAFMIENRLFGSRSAEFSVTMTTIIFASLAVAVLYLVVLELTGSLFASIAAAAVFSVNPLFLSVSTFAKSHSAAILFSLLTLYWLLVYLRQKKLVYALLFSLSWLLALLSRIDTILLLIPLLWLVISGKKILPKLKSERGVPFGGLLIAPLILWILSHLDSGFFLIRSNDISSGMTAGAYLATLVDSSGSLASAIGIFVLLTVIATLAYMMLDKESTLAKWQLVWFFGIFIPMGMIAVSSPRLWVGAMIPIAIVAGIGLDFVNRSHKVAGICLATLLVVASLASIAPVLGFRHLYPGPKNYGLYLKNVTEENAVILVVDDAPFVSYYGNRSVLGYPSILSREEQFQSINRVKTMLKESIPVYATSLSFVWEPGGTSEKELRQNFNLTKIGEVLSEDYHYSELVQRIETVAIYKVSLK